MDFSTNSKKLILENSIPRLEKIFDNSFLSIEILDIVFFFRNLIFIVEENKI